MLLAGMTASLVAFSALSDAQTLTALVDFSSSTGGHPYAAVVFDNVPGRSSVLYTNTIGTAGTSYLRYGCGSIVSLVPPTKPGGSWTLKVLHTFTGFDGDLPFGGLIFDLFGSLYGATAHGGALGSCFKAQGCGTVFKLTPPALPGDR